MALFAPFIVRRLERQKLRIFVDSYGNSSFVWDYFWFLVASWTRSSVVLSSIPFNSLLCNLGSILLPQENYLQFFSLIKFSFVDQKKTFSGFSNLSIFCFLICQYSGSFFWFIWHMFRLLTWFIVKCFWFIWSSKGFVLRVRQVKILFAVDSSCSNIVSPLHWISKSFRFMECNIYANNNSLRLRVVTLIPVLTIWTSNKYTFWGFRI